MSLISHFNVLVYRQGGIDNMGKLAICVPDGTKCPKQERPQWDILILTAKYGMGHYTTSMSLKQELENAKTEEEKEKARQEYLDRKGIHSSFRW